jgi:cell wall-associated NlpC family hydrolase
MKETPISNHPIRAGIAVVTVVAACAGVGFRLSQTTFATRDPISSAVEQLAYYLPGSMTAQAGLDSISDAYYYTAKVSINQVDLTTVQEELSNNLKQALSQTTKGLVTTRTVLYSQPDGKGEVICYLAPGSAFEAPQQEEDQSWYEIYWGELCGYVSAEAIQMDVTDDDLTQLADTTKEIYEDSYGTLTQAAVIYSQQDEESDPLLELAEGETLQLTSGDHGWYTVVYQGTQGYVLGDTVAYGADKPQWKIDEEKEALRQSVVDTAKQYMGRPYVYGASGPSSFDCSGFTSYIMNLFGVSIPRTAASQLTQSSYDVSVENLLPGDLVFFRSGDSSLAASHVGMYIGNGQFIHASSGAGYVTINNLSDSWYNKTYVGARRVL